MLKEANRGVAVRGALREKKDCTLSSLRKSAASHTSVSMRPQQPELVNSGCSALAFEVWAAAGLAAF